MYIDKDLIENKLYQLVDQFNERKTNQRNFHSKFLGNIHPFYDGNRTTCQILFAICIFYSSNSTIKWD